MVLALVLAFDARQTILGGLTAKRPELVVRVWDPPDLRAATRTRIEIRGGRVDLDALFHRRLDVALHKKAETADSWTGWLEFKTPSQLEAIPILRAIREVRGMAEHAVLQFEGGAGTMRLDLKEPPKDAFDLLSELRQQLRANRIVASIKVEEFEGDLDSWNPRKPILP